MTTNPDQSFLFRSPFDPDQRAQVIQKCLSKINQDFDFIQSHGYEEFSKRQSHNSNHNNDLLEDEDNEHGNNANNSNKSTRENLGTTFEGSLRDYQIFMLEHAKRQNAIVHLGTGMGKTLISIMLIQEYLSQRHAATHSNHSNHILFLVPSIALAVQHTDTLRANLSCIVETACHTSSHSSKAREDIQKADVIVATHGAALDLLRHYSDILQMSKVSLLVMDECHYATGDHNYATILKKFYHPLPHHQRPRILGLTASPLINVAPCTTQTQLQHLLSDVEQIMDCQLFGFDGSDGNDGSGGNGTRAISNIKEAEESVVKYSCNTEFDTSLPSVHPWKLHKSRKKEVDQLQHLCHEVGWKVIEVYSSTLAREVNQNEFERESVSQFRSLKGYLESVARHARTMMEGGRAGMSGGHTEKMRLLEELLEKSVKSRDGEGGEEAPVGIVFVERRITAIALCNYFCDKRKGIGCHPNGVRENGRNYCAMTSRSHIVSEDSFDSGRFDDAEDEPFSSFFNHQSSMEEISTPTKDATINCDLVVRQATQVFKYLGNRHRMTQQQENEMEVEWFHQTKRIRNIISKLRRRATNVLMATSVVEEGVDVETCSFIISFDGLKTIKSYIQMKGRARQKNAKFFVFVDELSGKSSLRLEDAQIMENAIHEFIVGNKRESRLNRLPPIVNSPTNQHFACDEEAALHREEYCTAAGGSADLSSSKSLVNRFALSVPLDPSSRSSKEEVTLHMPVYLDNKLTLPSHLPPDVREIHLPSLFQTQSKRKKHSLMALVAVVRLHKLGVLSDRLLPLSTADMKQWLLSKVLVRLPNVQPRPLPVVTPQHAVAIYRIHQSGELFCREQSKFVGCGRSLALVSSALFPDLPVFSFDHKEFGIVRCTFDWCGSVQLSQDQWNKLVEFHCILFNARWRRKRKHAKWLFYDESMLEKNPFPSYIVGCLQSDGTLDWDCMRKTIGDFSLSETQRKQRVQTTAETMPAARIWYPTYSPYVSYLVWGASGKVGSSTFPTSSFGTFQDYFATKYSIDINPNGQMFTARRLWELPQSFESKGMSSADNSDRTIDLPQELCAEALVADPLIMLHSVLLPQFLFNLEQYLNVTSFQQHCQLHFPVLGNALSSLSASAVREALLAKSCTLQTNYDRLEWLGDAVLKLMHSELLIKSEQFVNFHEGYLSMLRSAMGSNERLKDAAKGAGIDRFILLTPLSRSDWMPCGLRYHDVTTNKRNKNLSFGEETEFRSPSEKVCADVVESILGLVYLNFGLESATQAACEIGVSFSFGHSDGYGRKWSNVDVKPDLIPFSHQFLGVNGFNNVHLLEEAITHQSCLFKPVPSYQRLEWVGDAVLCLAAREWLYRKGVGLDVSKLVVLETTLVCNESLAYIGFKSGLHKLIDHRDRKLPGHFQSYQQDIEIQGRGLWSTDPPKIISDVVEALLGAVHLEKGFNQGQKSSIYILEPIVQSLSSLSWNSLHDFSGIVHPKQHLYELTGGIVRVRAYKKDLFIRRGIPCELHDPNKSIAGNNGSGKYVCVVSCGGIVLVVMAGSSSRAATNIACLLAVEMLKSNPAIVSRLQDIHLISDND